MNFFVRIANQTLMSLDFGAELKKAREAKGYTQADLAEKLNISARQVQKYEDGDFPKYKKETVAKIDMLLNTNLAELLYEHKSSYKLEIKSPDANDQGYREKYIAVLEAQVVDRQKEVDRLLGVINDKLSSFDKEIMGLSQNQLALGAILQAFRATWVRHTFGKSQYGTEQEAEAAMSKEIAEKLLSFQKSGSIV